VISLLKIFQYVSLARDRDYGLPHGELLAKVTDMDLEAGLLIIVSGVWKESSG
jgi:hypothetical protein